jgi:predicted nucleic acid-binding protein
VSDCKNSEVDPRLDQHVLAVDASVARRAAGMHVPDPAPFRDALIGATALVHRMTLVTRNIKDFARFDGLDISSTRGTRSDPHAT